jgi:hypothetical protein
MVGKAIDGANGHDFLTAGPAQLGLGITNDVASFLVSGGYTYSIQGSFTTTGIIQASHTYSMFSNSYTIYMDTKSVSK